MEGGLFLGLDVGTQGTKGLVLDLAAGEVVARASARYGLIEGLPPGAAEQHPHTWWRAVCEVVRALLTTPGVGPERILGVAVSGQQHGCVLLDANDEVLRPAKLWCDTETAAEAEELSATLGRRVPAGFTAPKVLWSARREPELFARTDAVLLPHDWVNLRLTGRRATEAGDASGTGYFDPRTRAWDPAALAAVDPRLAELVPEVLPAGALAGELTRAAAGELGLAAGTPVAAGGGDNMMSAIGAGATRPGVVVVSLGTSATAFARSETPVVDPDGLVAAFCDSAGAWLPLVCVMNCTGPAEEVRALAGGVDHAELTRLAEAVPRGAGGVLFVPYLAGERVPDLPRASGALLGLRAGSLAPAVLYRAALEGTSLNLGWGVERLAALGIEPSLVRLTGGGSRNPLWRRILADVLAAPIEVLVEPESAALGAALQAAWSVTLARGEKLDLDALARRVVRVSPGRVEPDPEGVCEYRERGHALREAVRLLYG